MDNLQYEKGRQALSKQFLDNILSKYKERFSDPKYIAMGRRKCSLACFKRCGLPYRVCYDISGVAPLPDEYYPNKPTAEQRHELEQIGLDLVRKVRRDKGNVRVEDLPRQELLLQRLLQIQTEIRGWSEPYSEEWAAAFSGFLIGYQINDFTEFDIYGTVGEHTLAELDEIKEKLKSIQGRGSNGGEG